MSFIVLNNAPTRSNACLTQRPETSPNKSLLHAREDLGYVEHENWTEQLHHHSLGALDISSILYHALQFMEKIGLSFCVSLKYVTL